MLHIHPLSAFTDNYIWIIEHPNKPGVYVVDPGDAKPVNHFLRASNNTIAGILLTHQHWDHVSGIAELVKEHACPVYGPAIEQRPEVTHPMTEGAGIKLWGELDITVLETPGHLPDHICWLIKSTRPWHLFCADTLFSAGCGRVFQGSHAELKASLDRLAALPPNTICFPTHEYTLANLKFAQVVEPNNPNIPDKIQEVKKELAAGKASLPTTIGAELRFNPFLRCDKESVKQSVNRHCSQTLDDDLAVFTELRRWKDVYS